jgi:hypothetical protein
MHLGSVWHGANPRRIGEWALFVHLEDGEGRPVWAGGVPLRDSLASAILGIPLNGGSLDGVAPGEYGVRVGMWNIRTGKRRRLSCETDAVGEDMAWSVRVGALRVVDRAE